MKKILSVMVSVGVVLSCLPSAMASDDGKQVLELSTSEQDQVRNLTRGEIEELAARYGQDPNTIVGATLVIPAKSKEQNNQQLESEFQVQDIAPEYDIRNISIGTTGGNIIFRDIVIGPAEYKKSVQNTTSAEISAKLSTELGMDAQAVSTKLGAELQTTIKTSITDTAEVKGTVPANKTYTFYVAPNFNRYTFELWEDDIWVDDYVGTFYYNEPMGYIFWHQDTTGW